MMSHSVIRPTGRVAPDAARARKVGEFEEGREKRFLGDACAIRPCSLCSKPDIADISQIITDRTWAIIGD
jgi:hypothetical protein